MRLRNRFISPPNDLGAKASSTPPSVGRVAIISSQAISLVRFRAPLIRALVARGVEVQAIASDYDPTTRAAITDLGARTIDSPLARAGLNPIRDLKDTITLWRLLRELRPDATLGYFVKPVIYGSVASWLARVPTRFSIIEGLGYAFAEDRAAASSKRKLLRAMVKLLYRIALASNARVFFLNDDDLDIFLRARIVDRSRVVRLGGIGLDLDFYRFHEHVSTTPTFVMIARLLREKGVYDYVEAARSVRAQFPGSRFILLGGFDVNPGSVSRREVEGWVERGVLEWPGEVDDVRPWLAIASVFVLPSYYREGLPRSTQEAMAIGRAVITTNSVGCRETVEHGVNGYLVPPKNVEALVDTMSRFIRDPTLVDRMGRASRAMAEDRYDVVRKNSIIMKKMGYQ